jgi:hypothetical protein
VLNDIEPEELTFRFMSKLAQEAAASPPEPSPAMAGLHAEKQRLVLYMRFMLETAASMYLRFYEAHVDWMRANVHSDPQQWSDLLRFARVIRNAAGHYGRISWDSPSPALKPVTWRNYQYSHADNGREILGLEFHIAPIVMLLFELSDELDALGCPQFG